jgi:hypothetical protein
MKFILFITFLYLFSSLTYAQGYIWSHHIGGDTPGIADLAYDIAINNAGESYIAGKYCSNAVDFDPGPGTIFLPSAGGSSGYFLAKYDKNGEGIWASKITGTDIEVNGIGLDSFGNSYICGIFKTSVTFRLSVGTITLTGTGNVDAFVAKYDANGNAIWARGATSPSYDYAYDMAVDDSGSVYISYNMGASGNINLGGTSVPVSTNGGDFFLVKYSNSGTQLWNRHFTSSATNRCFAIELDGLGHLSLAGYANCDMDLGSGVAYVNGAYIASFDLNGDFIWAQSFGGSATKVNDLVVDENGNFFVAGNTNNGDFDPGPSVASIVVSASTDLFLAKYDPFGNYLWAFNVGATSNTVETFTAIDLDEHGQIAATGFFSGSVDFNPGVSTNTLASATSSSDFFLAVYDSLGNYVSANRFGAFSSDVGRGIKIDPDENVIVVGNFFGTIDFDPGSGVQNETSNDASDMFMAKYCLHEPQLNTNNQIITTSNACQNTTSTYSVGGIINATDYEWTLPFGASITSGSGTDSINIFFSDSAQSGNIIVKGINPCGISDSVVLAITVDTLAPAIPSNFSGLLTVCQGATSVVYSVDTVPAASQYVWTFPNGVSVSFGFGTYSVATDFLTSALSGNITIAAVNGCGNGIALVQPISVSPLPKITSPISALTRVCFDDTVQFSANFSNATLYSWSYSNDWIAVGATNTSSLEAVCTKDTIVSVYAINSCGLSDTATFTIAVDTLFPSALNPILGSTNICSPSSNELYSVTNSNLVQQYNWSTLNGSNIIFGQGTSSINVTFGTSSISGIVEVYGENGCGNGPISSLSVGINPTPVAPTVSQSNDTLYSSSPSGNQWYNAQGAISGATNQWFTPGIYGNYYCIVILNACSSANSSSFTYYPVGIEEISDGEINVFPNPASSFILIECNASKSMLISEFYLLNLLGQKLEVPFTVLSENEFRLNIIHIESGVYRLFVVGKDNEIRNFEVIIN